MSAHGAGVGVRTVTLGGLPLLVAAVPVGEAGDRLMTTVGERGLVRLPAVTGVDLPRGARVGFTVDQRELRLVDEQDTTLLRAPRGGLDAGWLEAARRLRGTMTVLGRDVELSADLDVATIVARLDAAAVGGHVCGAIVGLVEERPTLPLFL
ncbi:hypothetical protein [Nitriliruptor alkaliphilus]|uniref:hypothetical protein n=1 Tax=Nitriliruptor alkaliphilus TaxID=427918 RepID=UPI0006972047|nr:hypothetical protein [Nitriliruptor alkaliphilus]